MLLRFQPDVIDLHPETVVILAGEDGKTIREEYSPDTVHPNAAGYAVMEAVLLSIL